VNIIWEEFEQEIFVDIHLNWEDLQNLRDGLLVYRDTEIKSQKISIGVISTPVDLSDEFFDECQEERE